MTKNPLDLPEDIAAVIVPFLTKAIAFTHGVSEGRWGLTDYRPHVRINAGFTEVITTSNDGIWLIVDRRLLPPRISLTPATVQYSSGKSTKGYYPSIPGSARVTVPYRPLPKLRAILKVLTPALYEAITKSGRRGWSRSVSAGHSSELVRKLAHFTGESLPQPRRMAERLTKTVRRRIDASQMEGALLRVVSNRYERNADARERCIAHHGATCAVCGFAFETAFGAIGQGFIHVHHRVPLASRGRSYSVDPVQDLIPVCPNCHAMLHKQDPPFGVDELRSFRRDIARRR